MTIYFILPFRTYICPFCNEKLTSGTNKSWINKVGSAVIETLCFCYCFDNFEIKSIISGFLKNIFRFECLNILPSKNHQYYAVPDPRGTASKLSKVWVVIKSISWVRIVINQQLQFLQTRYAKMIYFI